MEQELNLNVETRNLESVESYEFEPIKGYPMLRWKGKRPFTSTQYYPAKLKETFGEETNGWLNKLFWGDNLQVMSHLLKKFRGKVNLIYIDPPFDSKADYKKIISLRGQKVSSDSTNFEAKQYGDIWNNDEYLQFMYERIILLKELLSDTGTLYLHCDFHRSHVLRCILDEVFGADNIRNEIIWTYGAGNPPKEDFARKHDTIFRYSKSSSWTYNTDSAIMRIPFNETAIKMHFKNIDENGRAYRIYDSGKIAYADEGKVVTDVWTDIDGQEARSPISKEYTGYETQKPERLLERIIYSSSNPGDLIFDCFAGSGTTQAVAMRMGRRFIGADINLGAIDTTLKRLLGVRKELLGTINHDNNPLYLGLEVYNVNNYDVFRNPIQANELLVQALELQPLPLNSLYDGEKDGRMWKILPINRIANRADLSELISNFDYKHFAELQAKSPNKPVEKITLVCMGHEPDLAGFLVLEMKKAGFKIDVEVLDILRDRGDLQFRRDSEADVAIENGKLVIREFYPMNLLSKLSWEKQSVDDWRVLVDSIKIDFNYDGGVFSPTLIDIPEKNQIVKGIYTIPADAGTIRIKITDVLSESLEITIENN